MPTSAATPVGSPVEATTPSLPQHHPHPQMLVLIGSDGGRATVSHAIASEASYLLRDLLDGQDFSGAEPGSTVRVRWDQNGTSTGTASHSGVAGRLSNDGRGPRLGLESPSNSEGSDSEVAMGTLVEARPLGSVGTMATDTRTGASVHTGTVVGVKNQSHNGTNGTNNNNNNTAITPASSAPAIDLDAELFAAPGAAPPPRPKSTAVPDLMDFFQPAEDPHHGAANAVASAGKPGPNEDDAAWDNFLHASPPAPSSSTKPAPTNSAPVGAATAATIAAARSLPPPLPPPSQPGFVELPFPYFRGDILERVCQHMSYRFRTSTFGTENGEVRVFCTQPREVPKPMTMPLSEYLDSQDRLFVSEWDETLTLEILKAATLLNYDALYQLASAKLASIMVEKTVDGIRALLGVEGDFDATEEMELKKEQVIELPRL